MTEDFENKLANIGWYDDLQEARYIVSGRHQDQGYPKTKIYKADSEEHARKQFHDEHEDFHAFKIKKLTLNKLKNEEHKVGDRVLHDIKGGAKGTILSRVNAYHRVKFDNEKEPKTIRSSWLKKISEDHPNCGTPECCGQCKPLDEFVVTASVIAGLAAGRKAKKEAPKVGNYVKKQAFSQAKHLKDKVASIVSKRPDVKMSNAEYLKRKEAQIKEEVESQAERIKKLNAKTRRQIASNEKKIQRNKQVNEVLGPENQIGTKALVKKLQKLTPGQQKAQVNESKQPLIHYGVVMLHRANKEHKIIKFSEPHPTSLQNQTTGKWNLPHANAIHKDIQTNQKVKEHKANGWEVDHGVVSHHKSVVLDSVRKHLDSHAFRKFTLKEEIDLDEACWKDYKQLGMKKKGKKIVPNCVKESDEQNFRKQHNLEKAKKSVRQNIWGSHVGYIGKKRYTTFPDNVAAKHWLDEDVKSAETKGIIIPSYVDADGNTVPAKVVKRKVGNKILKTGDVHDGK